ncbi:MAG TPA: hypothetical protein VG649_02130 [Candidatus Angelobacter sp.]|jgi:hypothetical protein|nr:hypothetical protein [Candidatus Angelobacter sp.]
MSFLDNLESNLKNLESHEERDPAARKRRDSERASALAAAPWAEKLKNGPYAQDVLKAAAQIGFQIRIKIHVTWLDTTLKLEAKERRLEFRPTSDGIVAVFLHQGKEEKRLPVDLTSSGSELVQSWFGGLGAAAMGK